MLEFLVLLGLSVSVLAVGGGISSGSSETEGDNPDPQDPGTDDVIIASGFEDALTASLGADAVADFEFVEGPLDVNTGDGDDTAIGGDVDDKITTGAGDDLAAGGGGDDTVTLGDGNDTYGATSAAGFNAALADTDRGDDTIFGGDGDDLIADIFGSNTLNGEAGDDLLQSIDALAEEDPTPDTVDGGDGNDFIIADQGDTIRTGDGEDVVGIILGDGVGGIEGSETVLIEDFDITQDALQLGGAVDLDDLSIEIFADGTGSTILWQDNPIIRVTGGQALTLADIAITG